jgi:hypothetical protein
MAEGTPPGPGILKGLIWLAVFAIDSSYNRRHEDDSDGFDDTADGTPARAALQRSGMGGASVGPLDHPSDRPVRGQ